MAGDPPWVGGGEPAGVALRLAAGVGAGVESAAGGSLVDLPGAVRERLTEPVGVAAGVLDLVRRGGRSTPRSGIRPVGRPVPRPGGPDVLRPVSLAASARTCCRSRSASSCSSCPSRALRSACSSASPSEPAAGRRPLPPDPVSPPLVWSGASDPAGSGGPMIVRYSRAAWSSASSSPSGIHTSLANSSSKRCISRSPRTSRHRSRRPSRSGRVDDAVVGARLQVDGRAAGHVARQWRPGDRLGEEVFGERGHDHVGHGRLQRVADEPSAERAVGVLADAVGFHARLLEQPPVDGELPLDRVLGLRQRDVSVDRPPFGVLAVEGLVERDAEAAEHRAALEPAGDDLLAGSEQRV